MWPNRQYCSYGVSFQMTTGVRVCDVKSERMWKGMFQSIHYQVCEMCVVNIVSVMCHPTPVKQLVAAGWQEMSKDWLSSIKLDITRQGISKFQIPPLYICTSRSKSLPPQQPNPNSNSHPGSDPARGLQEAPSHPTDPTSEGNPGWHAHISILSTISHRMEIGPTAFLLSDGIGSQTTSDLCIPLPQRKEAGCWCIRCRF